MVENEITYHQTQGLDYARAQIEYWTERNNKAEYGDEWNHEIDKWNNAIIDAESGDFEKLAISILAEGVGFMFEANSVLTENKWKLVKLAVSLKEN